MSAHIFRHTMATMMLEGGADIRFVQAYTRVAIRKLKEVHAMSHPGAKLEIDRAAGAIDEQLEDLIAKKALFSSLAAETAEEQVKS